jgi:hypothetical protein
VSCPTHCWIAQYVGLLAPVYFKHAVDAMGQNAVQMTIAALLTSGLCRVINGVAKEIQHPCFTPISQVGHALLIACSSWAVMYILADVTHHVCRQQGGVWLTIRLHMFWTLTSAFT